MMKRRLMVLSALMALIATTNVSHAKDDIPMFQRFDKNGDGYLQLEELPRQLQSRISRFDTNQDDQISREEAQALRERFGQSGSSGATGQGGFRGGGMMLGGRNMGAMALPLDALPEQLQVMARQFDSNSDGELSAEEREPIREFALNKMQELGLPGDGSFLRDMVGKLARGETIPLTDLPEQLQVMAGTLDADGDSELSVEELRSIREMLGGRMGGLGPIPMSGDAPINAPTIEDAVYSPEFERSKMDVWLPEKSKTPVPMVVFYHGGGFVAGSKDLIRFSNMKYLTESGVAVASVGYPLVADVRAQSPGRPLPTIIDESGKALSYIRANADDWGVDHDRIILAGASAGAIISQSLAYVEREDVQAVLAVQQPWGADMIIDELQADAPAMFLFTISGEQDKMHSPRYARVLYDRCQEVGMNCHLYGSPVSGLPQLKDGEQIIDVMARELGW